MGFKDVLVLFVSIVVLSGLCFCDGYKFWVGGRDGWVVKPSEEYNHWAERNRFQVDDTLLFKYKQGDDSVLVVTRDNYVHCYTKTPIQTLTDGDSEFKFNRSGPFYFISGNEDHCKQGQRVIIVVLADRRRGQAPPPSPSQPAPPPRTSQPASPHESSSLSPSPSSTPDVVPPGSGEGVSPSGSASLTPAPAAKANFAAPRVGGGSLGLVTLCLSIAGATVLLNN